MKTRLFRRVVRWLLVILVVLFVVLNVIFPFGMGIYAATVRRDSSVDVPPDGFESLTLTTSDQVTLAAWYRPPENGAAIILIHGAGNTRDSVRGHAQMLVDHGFGVLAFDLRGHGESTGQTNLFGWMGTRDVGAAVDYLLAQEDVQAVGGLGLSLGGEVLLGAASEYPALSAVVADGPTDRCFEEFYALPSRQNVLRAFSPWIMYETVRLFSGDTPPYPMHKSIADTEATRFLIIAAGSVPDEGDYSTVFRDAAAGRADVWIAPGVGHTQAFRRLPDEYTQRVIGFFEETLVDAD